VELLKAGEIRWSSSDNQAFNSFIHCFVISSRTSTISQRNSVISFDLSEQHLERNGAAFRYARSLRERHDSEKAVEFALRIRKKGERKGKEGKQSKRKDREREERERERGRERERERERVPESCAKFVSTSLLYRGIPSICRFQHGFVAFGKVKLAALLFVHPHPSVLSAGTKLGIGSNPAPRPRQPLIIKNFTSRAAGFVRCLLKPEVRANWLSANL